MTIVDIVEGLLLDARRRLARLHAETEGDPYLVRMVEQTDLKNEIDRLERDLHFVIREFDIATRGEAA